MDKVLSYLGIARKAGLLETGEENCGIVVRGGKAKLLLLAADASGNATRRAEGYVHGRNIPLLRLPQTKLEISQRVGKSGCSMVALTDLGLALSLVQALAAAAPEQGEYAPLLEQLRLRQEKARKRKTEAKAHERNKKTGKRRKTV